MLKSPRMRPALSETELQAALARGAALDLDVVVKGIA
jgi:hypothetical protein